MPNNTTGPGNDTGFAAEDLKYHGALTQALNYVENLFNNLFTNNVTINITINFDSTIGVGGENNSGNNPIIKSYADVKSALVNTAQDSLQQSAYSNLPSTDPTGSNNFALAPAYAAALGLTTGPVSKEITFNSSWYWTTGLTIPYGFFVGILEHELTEIMGRVSVDGQTENSAGRRW
jgi:hypothetical protein